MRFVSKHRSYCLIVLPTDYVIEAGRRRTVRGLRAEFVEFEFDSQRAQAQNRWTDAQREEVEQELLRNNDFGIRYVLSDTDSATPVIQASPVESDEGMCQVTFMTPEGAVRCANKAKGGSAYCAAHQSVAAKVSAEEA